METPPAVPIAFLVFAAALATDLSRRVTGWKTNRACSLGRHLPFSAGISVGFVSEVEETKWACI